MKIGIIPNQDKKNASEVLVALKQRLDNLGVEYNVSDNYDLNFDVSNETNDFFNIYKESDIIIAVGGDGTIIHTAKIAAMFSKPVLGINSGHTGYMAGLEPNELHLIKKLIDDDYHIENRMMFEVAVSSKPDKVYYCLNDLVLSKGPLDFAFDIELYNNSKQFMFFRCDGLIASTPTGSTAYAMSAGGPVTDPSIECMLFVPICPISTYSRGFVISADSKIDILCKTKANKNAYVNFDGLDGFCLNDGDVVSVSKSRKYVTKLIKIKNDSFFDVLKNKIAAI